MNIDALHLYLKQLFSPLFSLNISAYLILALGIFLWIITARIIDRFYASNFNLQQENRQRILRAIILYSLFFYLRNLFPQYDQHWITLIFNVLAVAYLAFISFNIINYYILKRFGRIKEISGKISVAETYSSRLLRLIATAIIFIIALVVEIRILGYQSLLEAGGAIGIIGVFLALTQNVWAPDIFNGLIILNSEMFEEDDVIEINEENIVGVVFKTKMFHTEILNLVNNHRMMIRNAKLRDYVIHNLSCFSSAKGLREKLTFNIGYDNCENSVRAMFQRAFETATSVNKLPIESQYEPEILVEDCGDDAVLWAIHYYLKDVKSVMSTRALFRETILKEARSSKITLATPKLYQRLAELSPEQLLPESAQEKRLAAMLEEQQKNNT